jgi:hypothetical protein
MHVFNAIFINLYLLYILMELNVQIACIEIHPSQSFWAENELSLPRNPKE